MSAVAVGTTAPRRPLDADLVRRGLASEIDAARALVDAGRVRVSGVVADNASRQVGPDEPVVVVAPPARFVSRGGEKLDAALDRFRIDVSGRRVLDAGASTGGFSDCVLQRGAAAVVAVDVGYGQLHARVAGDARVRVLDRTNVRHLAEGDIGGPVDLVVADLSFISLRTVLPALLAMATPGADLVVLVKPQFEAPRDAVDRGRGVIGDPEVWRGALDGVIAAFTERGATIMGAMASPLTGSDGNVEFLLHALAPGRRTGVGAATPDRVDVADAVDAALAEARAGRG